MAKPNEYNQQAVVTDDTELYHQTGGVNTKTTASQWKEYIAGDNGGGDTSYIHDQPTPSLSWSITHNLGKFPNLTVKEGANTVEGDITYSTNNSLIISFTSPTSGKAYLS